MAEFNLAARLAREYADQCDADNDPVRAQWARAQAAKYERCRDGDSDHLKGVSPFGVTLSVESCSKGGRRPPNRRF